MVKHRHQIAYDVVLVLLPSTLLGSTAGVFLNKVCAPNGGSCCICAACACALHVHTACALHVHTARRLHVHVYCMCTLHVRCLCAACAHCTCAACALHEYYQMCPNWLIMLLLVLLCGYSGKRTLSKGFQQ